MAWTPQGGGQGPWGSGPSGPQQPDIEEILRRGQDKLRRMMPSGTGSPRGFVLAGVIVLIVWMLSGLYRVQTNEQGVVMLFGKFVQATGPGLHWFFPAPIGRVQTPVVTEVRRVEIGFRSANEARRAGRGALDVPEESMVLTGDQNIADIDFTVFWDVKDAPDYLFNIRDPEGTVKKVAESAMREVVGQTGLSNALTDGRQQIELRTMSLTQGILDEFQTGIRITAVQLLKVDPPAAVIDAFNEVQRARQDKERLQNEAEAYKNRIVPQARGEAAKIVQDAMAYEQKVIQEAQGEALQFTSVFETYLAAKEITLRRMYLEAMETVLKGANKIIIDTKGGGSGVIPYLPLPELQKRLGPTGSGTGDKR